VSQLELEALHQEMRSCRACELRGGCSLVVPGEGAADALVVFFGEGPGEDEDKEGRPFVGRSGQFLREQMRLNSIETEKVYISNIARCRPPENRTPTMAEMEACWPWTEKTLHVIKHHRDLGEISAGGTLTETGFLQQSGTEQNHQASRSAYLPE